MATDQSLLLNAFQIRREADELLTRIRPAFEEFAPLRVVGSYTLDLMVWRDLDLLVEATSMTIERFFELGQQIAMVLSPMKMSFTDYREQRPEGYSPGLYWGIRLGDIRQGAWKIDLWAFEPDVAKAKLRECESLKTRLDPQLRLTILRLKSELWNDPQYRKDLTSQHIYDAVLDHGATTVDDVWLHVRRTK